ncbi:hypothetical protein AKJ64_03835 [candidate division MSBL1 archaeon SCGC-AAA259E17]|uniref:thymine-DNA glycosylase n=1 Tax=candidate division MSBL1 archaeon SCGC-AAA259E17 TaxID=1698263 RepID=A0A133UDH4_9EURY|nr:hypothetical protein AKJ64_03835 [candidate division MSBL1 archaeon SCGC-AAA259E17]
MYTQSYMVGKSFKPVSDKESRVIKIISRLEDEFQVDSSFGSDPFLTLVRTVLSQNTNSRNTRRAFDNLTPEYTSPKDFAEADPEKLEELIRPAGLYRSKARNLQKLARIIINEHEGSLEEILEKSRTEARKELIKMPGVGPKTADCVLLFADGRDVLPVDTHVSRTTKRLGFAHLDDDPEAVKEKLEPLVPEGERGKLHLLLIALGREYCKAPTPICESCPIDDLCPRQGVD